MRHSYNEMYVRDAQLQMSTALDYLVNTLHLEIKDFFNWLFIDGSLSRLENGDPHLISGKSGVELVNDLFPFSKPKEYKPSLDKTPEYWLGYYLAFYQWYSGRRYIEIFKRVPFDEMLAMYHPYHEMDVMKFVDAMDEKIKTRQGETNLKKCRMRIGMSQSDLAKASGVNIRSIQLYEQRVNDIDKAQGQALYKIAKALHVSIEDILEEPGIDK